AGGRTKDDVRTLTACYADLDLHGAGLAAAQGALERAACPPSLIVHSGYGLHAIWWLEPTTDKASWRAVQHGIRAAFAAQGADRAVAGDESRVLRLVPYPNRKHGGVVPTAVLAAAGHVYTLRQLRATFPPPRPPATCCVRGRLAGDGPVPPGLVRFAQAGQPAGGRNNGGFWLACRLVEQVGDAAAGRRLLDEYGAHCSPPLDPTELDRIWASAGRATGYQARRCRPP
ncbi:MAG TPA: primase alpha helix C-terminal domain-containing protein, partial [Chloroflexia bacterium]|nr:primase alpha helix C-terminal domain-containing protein [Chloroflexia bacterium]